MTLRDLKEFINALDLNEVSPFVELFVQVDDDCNGAKGYTICDDMVDFDLIFPEGDGYKPYLSISGKTFCDFIDSLHDDKED